MKAQTQRVFRRTTEIRVYTRIQGCYVYPNNTWTNSYGTMTAALEWFRLQ